MRKAKKLLWNNPWELKELSISSIHSLQRYSFLLRTLFIFYCFFITFYSLFSVSIFIIVFIYCDNKLWLNESMWVCKIQFTVWICCYNVELHGKNSQMNRVEFEAAIMWFNGRKIHKFFTLKISLLKQIKSKFC